MENKKDYEEIQLSNLWIKEHVLDIIERINKYEVIAKIGCSDMTMLSQMEGLEITQERINALNLMNAEIEVLKGNVFFKISNGRKLTIFLLFKQLQKIGDPFYHRPADDLNELVYVLTDNFEKKLQQLQKIKEKLIDACADAGMFLPKKDEDLEIKTSKDLEDEDE